MLPRILDVPRRNFHGFFSMELYSCHSGRMQMRGVNQAKEKSESADSVADNLQSMAQSPEETWKEARDTEERLF